jgi:WD40 repeat protein
LAEEGKAVLGLAIDIGSKSIAVLRGHYDESPEVAVWDALSRKRLLKLDGSAHPFADIAFGPGGVQVAVQEGERVRVFGQAMAKELCCITGTRPKFSSDGRRICTLVDQFSKSCRVMIWDVESGTSLAMLQQDASLATAGLSQHGDFLTCIDNDGVHVWEVASSRRVSTMDTQEWRALRVCFSPDSRRIAVCTVDGVTIWDHERRAVVSVLQDEGGGDRISQVFASAFSPDGTRLVTGSLGSSITLWDTATGREVLSLDAPVDRIKTVAFSSDGTTILAGGSNGGCCIWRLADSEHN